MIPYDRHQVLLSNMISGLEESGDRYFIFLVDICNIAFICEKNKTPIIKIRSEYYDYSRFSKCLICSQMIEDDRWEFFLHQK